MLVFADILCGKHPRFDGADLIVRLQTRTKRHDRSSSANGIDGGGKQVSSVKFELKLI